MMRNSSNPKVPTQIKVDNLSKTPKNFTGIVEYSNGTKEWYVNDILHREDGPAIEFLNGCKFWYSNGNIHREDGPAIEQADGGKEWWLNDKCHRIDGPAVERPNGDKHWYLNGKIHRTNGPAIEYVHGTREWWLNGKLHRMDGPAIEQVDGSKKWYLNGKYYYSEEEWKKEIAKTNDPSNKKYIHSRIEYSNKVPRNFTGIVCHLNGFKQWYLNDEECSEIDFFGQ